MSVPTFTNFDFSPAPEQTKQRYQHLAAKFHAEFPNEAIQYYTRAPGRVNLMGDHIDYNLFLCLPMAIDFDLVAAVHANPESLEIALVNTDPKFTKQQFTLPEDGLVITIDDNNFNWSSYFRCALIVAHKYLLEKGRDASKPLVGMHVAFDGTVPTGGGLSSSAAFCVASTLAILKANGVDSISKADLTRITVVSEHYIGLNNGGLDQCSLVYGEDGMCLLVQFRPKLNGIPLKFPTLPDGEELKFIISNTLVESPKKLTAPVNYNLRVVEMGIALDLLAKKFNLSLPSESNINSGTLRGFMETYFVEVEKQLPWDGQDNVKGMKWLQELTDKCDEWFTTEEKVGFTTEEAAAALGLSVEEFTQKYLTKMEVRYDKLKLYQRAKHVFSESYRVLQCLHLLQTIENGDDFLREFGGVMNASQQSLDQLNGLSHPNCNRICEIALANGAYGTRVTGAGFGGSLVSITTAKKLPNLVNALVAEYYKKEYPNITDDELANALVDTKPAWGASVVAAAAVE